MAASASTRPIGVDIATEPNSSAGSVKCLKEPATRRELTTREKIILLENSRLHGCIFPPWKTPPDPSEFAVKDFQDQFLYVTTRDRNHWDQGLIRSLEMTHTLHYRENKPMSSRAGTGPNRREILVQEAIAVTAW